MTRVGQPDGRRGTQRRQGWFPNCSRVVQSFATIRYEAYAFLHSQTSSSRSNRHQRACSHQPRRPDKYQLVYKDKMDSPISAAVVADYRMSGAAELLVVSANGEVRGYIPTAPSSGLAGGSDPISTNKRKQQQVWVVDVSSCITVAPADRTGKNVKRRNHLQIVRVGAQVGSP